MAIDEGASANIEVNKGESEAPKLDLVNNGTVSELTLSTKADVNVSGKITATAIPVTSTASAGGSTISTSQNLNLKAESKVELTLNAGAESTTAAVSDVANIPDVKGLGKVQVKDSDSGKILDTVVAEKDENVAVNKGFCNRYVKKCKGITLLQCCISVKLCCRNQCRKCFPVSDCRK